MSTLIDCAETLNCATLSGSNNVNVNFQAGVPNKIVVSLSQSVVGLSKLEVTGNAIISDNSSNAALRITQIGSGEAIRVEDSANPDSTPFIINSAGNVGIGTASPAFKLDIGGSTGRYETLLNINRTSFAGSTRAGISFDNNWTIGQDANGNGTRDLFFYNGATATAPLYISSTNNVGIGTTSPSAELDVVGDGFINLDLRSAGATGFAGSYITLRRSQGTTASRTIVQNGDYVGGYLFSGYDGSVYRNVGAILGIVDGVPGSNDMPGAIAFSTTADGAGTETERMRINSAGNVGIGTGNPNTKLHISGSQIIQGNLNNTSTRPAVAGGTLSANELRAASFSSVSNNDGFMRISAGGGTGATSKTFIDISGYSTIPDMENNIAFGTSGVERIRIDNTGSVGIGTTAPAVKMHVSSSINEVARFESNSSLNDSFIRVRESSTEDAVLGSTSGVGFVGSSTATSFAIRTNNTNKITVTSAGNVGIGIAPTYLLQLGTDSAAKPSTSTWTVVSDIRVKENVQNYSKGLEILCNINPVTYDYNGKAGFEKVKNNIGLIAQDVKEFLPESISTYKAKLNSDDTEDTELYNFNSHALTYVLINSVKQLKQENDVLKNTLNEVLARLSVLENK